MRKLRSHIILFCLVFFQTQLLFTQDTIQFAERKIRVGELEWDMYKDWTGKGFAIAEDSELYGDSIKIYIGFHRNRVVEQITFGYFKTDSVSGDIEFISHGPARYYDPDGLLFSKRKYDHGIINGGFTDFYANGKTSAKGKFEKGILQGEYLSYYDTGEIECKMFFENDLEQGEQICFHRNGTLMSKVSFKRGKVDGPDSSWYNNGRLEAAYLYKEGMEQDTGKHFHSNGSPFSERIFLEGKLVQILYIKDKEGKDLNQGDFRNGNGRLNIYSDDGILNEVVTYENGFVKKIKYYE